MCGIAGFIVKKDVPSLTLEKLLDELLHGIANRGGDATGFVARSSDGTTEWEKAACDVAPFIEERHPLPEGTVACLAHTRFATQGTPGFARNNHPIRRGPFYLVHNGVISNERVLYALAGREPYGAVDSEALAAVVAAAGTLDGSLRLLEQARGSAAIAVLDERSGDVMLARLASSPLYVLETRRLIIFASTSWACEQAHKRAVGSLRKSNRAVGLLEGEAVIIPANGNARTLRFEKLPFEQSWSFLDWEDRKKDRESYVAAWTLDEDEEQLPAHDGNLARPVDDLYPLNCEICQQTMDDPYDLYDGDDRYLVCDGCFDTFAGMDRIRV